MLGVPDTAAHLAAWCDLLCQIAGLPPAGAAEAGVVSLPQRAASPLADPLRPQRPREPRGLGSSAGHPLRRAASRRAPQPYPGAWSHRPGAPPA